MKIPTFLLMLLAWPLIGFSQEILYEDNFDRNFNQWQLSGNFIQPVFKDWKMSLKGYSEEDMAVVLSQVVIDPSKDYSINCNFSYSGGT
jgi:hypothetical protein